MDPTFLQLLTEARRKEIIRTKGRPKLPRPVVPQYPKLPEIRYQTRLLRLVQALGAVAVKWARNEYPAILKRYQEDGTTFRTMDEDAQTLILSLTQPLQAEQYALDLEGQQAQATTATAETVNAWVARRFSLERQLALGTVYDPAEPWVQRAIGDWTATNRQLVKSLVGEHLSRMETMALDAVTNGKRPEQLLIDVMKANKMSYNRARLIARDQIGKLTAQLVEKRSKDMGLDTYTWKTAMDERVRGNPAGRYPTARPSHWGAEGKIGVYGKPGIWIDPSTGKEVARGPNDPQQGVGFDIGCRCTAASRWEDLIRPIDQSLLEDPYVLAEMGKGPWPE
jgi:uncharacterized protein with gpF-like domain